MGIKRSRVLAIEALKTVNNFDNKFHAKLGPDDILVKHDFTSHMVQKAQQYQVVKHEISCQEILNQRDLISNLRNKLQLDLDLNIDAMYT